ncbi:MAG: hydrogenase maturation protease [Chitinophagaceae bacterium]|jgi:hydrogenase maturation protease|nr:hydrogenase maturation protease [Chitinophagaceae bacterium]
MGANDYREEKPSILLLGIGNYLMGDEGLGVHLARTMEHHDLPPCVEVVDGGTGGFHLLEYFERFDHVIMIDAALDEQPVGTITLRRPRFAADFPRAMSTHDIGMRDLVNALQLLDRMPDLWLITVSIESLQQQGIELTPEIAAMLPGLQKKTSQLIESLACREVAL